MRARMDWGFPNLQGTFYQAGKTMVAPFAEQMLHNCFDVSSTPFGLVQSKSYILVMMFCSYYFCRYDI